MHNRNGFVRVNNCVNVPTMNWKHVTTLAHLWSISKSRYFPVGPTKRTQCSDLSTTEVAAAATAVNPFTAFFTTGGVNRLFSRVFPEIEGRRDPSRASRKFVRCMTKSLQTRAALPIFSEIRTLE